MGISFHIATTITCYSGITIYHTIVSERQTGCTEYILLGELILKSLLEKELCI